MLTRIEVADLLHLRFAFYTETDRLSRLFRRVAGWLDVDKGRAHVTGQTDEPDDPCEEVEIEVVGAPAPR